MWGGPAPGAVYSVTAAAVYLIASFLVTGVGNVPLNNSLAKVDADTVNAAQVWAGYAVLWTRWNHVRAVACMIAAGALVLSLTAG